MNTKIEIPNDRSINFLDPYGHPVPNTRWVELMNFPEEVKEGLMHLCFRASMCGCEAIQCANKIREFRGMSKNEILKIFNDYKESITLRTSAK